MIKQIFLAIAIISAALANPVLANDKDVLLSQNIAASSSSNYSIKGNIELLDTDIRGGNDNCYGAGGYSDMNGYMPVTVWDDSGKIIATGQTLNGKRDEAYPTVVCNFLFEVSSVPKSNFYTIEVGKRGKLNYSFTQMQEMDWNLELSLGS